MSSFGFNFGTTYTKLPSCFFSILSPKIAPNPSLVVFNNSLARDLGLDLNVLSQAEKAELFVGNKMPENATPFAQAYCGHQYGYFTSLGDGRALMWGEHITPSNNRVDLQFKGSGPTPYSRQGDGRAALGPMLREYIISEAMHHLNIPTSRSLAVATTGETVFRNTPLTGAILTRVASSHIRVGTFEFAAQQNDVNLLSQLLDYSIERHYPELINSSQKAYDFLKVVMQQQISLIVNWMRVGFVHGVMNTDNMLVSGETIDYGPCAFMDNYDPNTVFSSIDKFGRYSYINQPIMAQWNLARLAESLLPLINLDPNLAFASIQELINQFPLLYEQSWLQMMASKLGISDLMPGDKKLITDLLNWMQLAKADYTNTFQLLMQNDPSLYKHSWYNDWQTRVKKCPGYVALMQKNNPAVIPRNHVVESVLESAQNSDFKPLENLIEVLSVGDSEQDYYKYPPKDPKYPYKTFCGT